MSFGNLHLRAGVGLPVAFVAGLAVAYATSGAGPHLSASVPPAPALSATAPAPTPASLATASYANAVDRAAPAVVKVEIEKTADVQPADGGFGNDFLQQFFGQGRNRPQVRRQPAPVEEGIGSGVIMTPDGTILTNNHVIDGAQRVTVLLSDGREFPAKVVGADPPTDLAVIRINATDLPTIAVADSNRVRVGDVVLAVGNPLNVGETVTMGIISAKGRQTDLGDDNSYEDFLQTDAPINVGNSGGALITTTGELVGINSQIMSPSGGSVGIGFAIPSDMAENVMKQLTTGGHVHRGMLGVTVQGLSSDLAKSLGLSTVNGALVDSVTADSPGARAGLKQGDVIVKLDGQPIDDSNALRNRVSEMTPGSRVTLDVQRSGRIEQMTATLGEMPATGTTEKPAAASGSDLGMTLESLTPALAEQAGVPRSTVGVLVTSVDPAGAAARAGIQNGDVIRQVNGRDVRTPSELHDAFSARSGRPAFVSVQRGDNSFFVALPTAK